MARNGREAVLGRAREVWVRARSDGFGFVLSRGLQSLRDRAFPPWHHLFWIPPAELGRERCEEDRQLGLQLRVFREELDPDWVGAMKDSVGASSIPLFQSRLKAGCELHVLLKDDRIAGTRWWVPGTRTPFHHVVLTEHDVMGMDGRIHPAFRRQGLNAPFFRISMRELDRRGFQRAFFDCSEHNERSLRTYRRIGLRFLLRYRESRGRYRFDAEIPA